MSSGSYPTAPTRQRVEFEGSSYIVCAERIAAAVRVWIELAEQPGTVWRIVSDGADVLDARNEIAVLLHEDERAEQIALITGWFQRTGNAISKLGAPRLMIWRLTESSPLVAKQAPNLDSLELQSLMRRWAEELKKHSVSGIVVTGPDAFGVGEGRSVVAAYPEPLRARVSSWGSHALMADKDRSHPAAEWGDINNAPYRAMSDLKGLGYAAWVSVRLPAAAGDHLEAIMFGSLGLLENNNPAIATATALNLIGPVRRAVAASSIKLTKRELDVLKCAYLSAADTSSHLGIAEGTVNHHRGNVMSKLKTNNISFAFVRAQKLGLLD